MSTLRVLLVEDSEDDGTLLLREIRRGGYEPVFRRVDTKEELETALDEQPWEVALVDYVLPGFDVMEALALLRERKFGGAIIVVSGAVDEETAVETMRAGAHDYVLKSRLSRLVPVLRRELQEANDRQRAAAMEWALMRSQEQYASLFQESHDAVYITTREGRFVDVNPAAVKLFGYSREELMAMNVVRLFADEQDRREFREVIEREGAVRDYEIRFRRKDGAQLECLVNAVVWRRRDGGIAGYRGIIRDVTRRRRARKLLAAAAAEWETSFDAIEDSISIHDRDYNILRANAATLSLLGVSRDDLAGTKCYHLYHGQDHPPETCPAVRCMCTSKPVTREFFEPHLGRYVEVKACPRFDAQGRLVGLVHLVRDLTDRKEAEDELRRTNERLQTALEELRAAEETIRQHERLRALGRMASGIAHDFRNALMPVTGFCDLLLIEAEKLPDYPKVKHYAECIRTAASDAAGIVGRLREFYREPDPRELSGEVNLCEVVQQVKKLTEPKWRIGAQEQGRTIEVKLDLDPLTPTFAGSEVELRELVTNLVFNAVDALPEGGTITLRVRRERGGAAWREAGAEGGDLPVSEQVVVEVSDTGTGMDDEVRWHCLDPYFTTKKETGGSGMGLAMVHGTVRRHQGVLEIDTELGKGTTFRVRLPVRSPEEATVSTADRNTPVGPLYILCVDDEIATRQVLADLLAVDGHTVRLAHDGVDGLKMFRRQRFDLVITDRVMPRMRGDELAAAVKRIAPNKPVIMLTGLGDSMKELGEYPEGVDLVVTKPVTLNMLRGALAMVIGRDGIPRASEEAT